jgi:hypothetical protein
MRLGAEDPRVLSSRGNLLVHLAPAPVVARVATLTAWTRDDPFRWLAREVSVAGYAARRDGPVIPPADVADPGPHRQDGFAISLWCYRKPEPDRPTPAEVGAELGRLHLALSGCRGDLPPLAPVRELITEGLDALGREQVLDPGVLARLRDQQQATLTELTRLTELAGPAAGASTLGGRNGDGWAPVGPLHGDAHGGNLMRTGGRWLWFDLEETCWGSRLWDLAVAAARPHSASPNSASPSSASTDSARPDLDSAALAAYAAVTGTPVPSPADLAPWSEARMLEGAVWSLGMAHQYPDRYQAVAQRLLDQVLASS